MIQPPSTIARPIVATIRPLSFGRAVRMRGPASRFREDVRFFLYAYAGALIVFLTWLA